MLYAADTSEIISPSVMRETEKQGLTGEFPRKEKFHTGGVKEGFSEEVTVELCSEGYKGVIPSKEI